MSVPYLGIVLLIGLYSVEAREKHVVCYVGTWATYRNGLGKFDITNIEPQLCTHAVYSFVGINNKGELVSLDPYLDLPDNYGRDNFGRFNKLKTNNPRLKTLLAVGGWNEGSAKYSTMAASASLRKNFITSAVNMIRRYGFDGLDIDWEYPNQRDTVYGKADIANFVILLKELKMEFSKYGLMVTAPVAATKSSASTSYDIRSMAQYLDLIMIMAYDMYGPWDSVTGHNAALHKGEGYENIPKQDVNSVDVVLEYWLTQGCPPEKLVLGLPFYGHTFKLANANNNGVRAPNTGPGLAGPYTASNGMIGYNEFCDILQKESWKIRKDILSKVPFAVQDTDWVSYDDTDSIAAKVEYALKLDIAGVMIWSIDTDDFNGVCKNGKFPLLKAVNRVLDEFDTTSTRPVTIPSTVTTSSSPPPTSSVISSTSTSTTTSIAPSTVSSSTQSSGDVCSELGLTKNPKDCGSFYVCTQGLNGRLVGTLVNCPATLHWDQNNLYCNYPELAGCE